MSLKPVHGRPGLSDFLGMDLSHQLETLRLLDPASRARYLLAADDIEELMAGLPTQDVFLMFKVLGSEDFPELLDLVTAEQWTGFFDLDCWEWDRFDLGKAREWLYLLLGADIERVAENLLEIDFDLLVLILKKEIDILVGPEDIEDEEERLEAIRSNGGYIISFRDEDGGKLFDSLLKLLFGVAPDFYRYLLNAVRADTESLIEESVYLQRVQRLNDLGFCAPLDARLVYSWLDPEKFRDREHDKLGLGAVELGAAPGFPLLFPPAAGLLSEILSAGISEAQAWELAAVTNKVMLADQVELGDLTQVEAGVHKVNATLNLAIEWLSANDLDVAERLFANCYCEELFRVGYSLTLQLKRRAERLCDALIAPFLSGRQSRFLEVLRGRHPRLLINLIDPNHDGDRDFASLLDLQAAERFMTRLEMQRRLCEDIFGMTLPAPDQLDLSGCQPDDPEELTVAHFFLTALANQLLGRDFTPQPISVEEMIQLHPKVSIKGRLDEKLARETQAWLESLLPGAGWFAEECLDLWREGFCAVPVGQLDARFVSGLIVKKR